MSRSGSSDDPRAHAATVSAGSSSGAESTIAAPAGAAAHLRDDLAATEAPSQPLGEPPRELGDAPPPSARYLDRHEIARGGLGRISRTRDQHLGRAVVVKEMLRRGRDEARFVREAIVTASLQHPGIVPVYDAGRWAGGEPFFAMRPIEGRQLGEALAAATTLDARLALLPNLLRATEAVAYAHAHGVIHRDLKPSNILVGAYGDTVVIDWGLAKRIGTVGTDSTVDSDAAELPPISDGAHTVAGAVMGTPAYMPPEQAESSDAVDARADVYALGAILYQLLVGAPPFTGTSSEQILDRVRSEPPKPVTDVVPAAPRDLVAIVDKAMARDAADRYPTARELVAELERFTTGRLVAAHAYTRRELIARFVRKNRAAVSVAAIAFATIAVAGAIAINQILDARTQAQREKTQAIAARDQAEQNRRAAVSQAAALLVKEAHGLADRDPYAALATLARLPAEIDDWTPAMLVAATAVGTGLPRSLEVGQVDRFDVSADGKVLAAVLTSGQVMVWSDGQTAMRPLDGTSGSPNLLTLSRDGRWLAAADTSGRILHWDTTRGTMRTLRQAGPQISGMWPRADGSVVIYDQGPVVFPAAGGAEQRPLGVRTQHDETYPLWDDRHVVESDSSAPGAAKTGMVYVVDLETTRVILSAKAAAPGPQPYSASSDERVELVAGQLRVAGKSRAFDGSLVSPDGAFVIIQRGGIVAYHLERDSYQAVSSSPEARLVGFLGDSHILAVRERTTVHLVDLDHHTDHVIEIGSDDVAAGEHWLATRVGTRGLRIIDRERASSRFVVYWDEHSLLATSPSGRWYAFRTRSPVERIDLYGPAGHALELDPAEVKAMAISGDENWLAIVGPDGSTRLRELATGKERTMNMPAHAIGVWAGPRGAWVIGMVGSRSVVWDASDGSTHELATDWLLDVTVAGPNVVTTTSHGDVTVWDARWQPVRRLRTAVTDTPAPRPEIVRFGNNVLHAAAAAVASPDGRHVAVADPSLRIVDIASGAVVWQVDDAHLDCDPEMIASGRLIAYCGDGLTVFDVADGRAVATLRSDERPMLGVLSPDGRHAFTIHRTQARVWELAGGASRSVPWDTESALWFTAIFEGLSARVVGARGVQVVPHDVPADPAAFRAWLAGFADAAGAPPR